MRSKNAENYLKGNRTIQLSYCCSEVDCLQSIRHPAIVSFYDYGYKLEQAYILMEYCPDGDLATVLAAQYLPLGTVIQYAKDMLSALIYLKSMHIVHSDIKPENIMVCGNHAKLADFGLSFSWDPTDSTCDNDAGSPVYSAPEVLLRYSHNPYMAEVWSFGMLLFEMVYRFHPYELKIKHIESKNQLRHLMIQKLVDVLMHDPIVFLDEERKKRWNITNTYTPVPTNFKDTITKCLQVEIPKRHTFETLLTVI